MFFSRRILVVIAVVVVASGTYYYYVRQSSPRDISVERAKELIEKNPNIIVVDVRTPEEFAAGHIEGAINLCVECDAQKLLDNLDPDDKILLYCRTGRRSANAMKLLNENGYNEVYNMIDGIVTWINAGYPTIEN